MVARQTAAVQAGHQMRRCVGLFWFLVFRRWGQLAWQGGARQYSPINPVTTLQKYSHSNSK